MHTYSPPSIKPNTHFSDLICKCSNQNVQFYLEKKMPKQPNRTIYIPLGEGSFHHNLDDLNLGDE